MRNEDTALRQRIEAIRAAVGPGVTLVAATKTVPPECINEAIRCGVRVIGENRVQELLEKYDAIDRANVQVHFIGQLQTNKVKYIADKVDMIQSLDSLPLAREIEKRCAALGRTMDCLVEVNLEGEAAKGGEGLGAEEREQVEGHVVVQILLNVARQAAQHRANNHGGDCTGRAHAPHGVAGERESGDDAEHR